MLRSFIHLCVVLALFSVGISSSFADDNKKILVVSAMHGNRAKVTLLKDQIAKHGIIVEQKSSRNLGEGAEAIATLSVYDLVILDAVSSRNSGRAYGKFAPVIAQANTKIITLKQLDNTGMNKGVALAVAKNLHDYYDNGGVENFSRMADYIAEYVFGPATKEIASPIMYPEIGIYAKDYDNLVFANLDEYLQFRGKQLGEQPVVGIMMMRSQIETASTHIIDTVVSGLEEKGVLAVPFFFELSPFSKDYTPLLIKDGKTSVDLIVNFRNIHWAAKRAEEFKKLGVPVMQALTYFDGDQKAWEADTMGISPTMTPFTLILPETAGVIDPIIVAAMNQETGQPELIDYQVDHLTERAVKYAALKHKANADKKLAVMVWGDKNVGASFLNIEESLRSISGALNADGYSIDAVESSYFTDGIDRILNPFYRNYELDALLADDLAELMPVESYLGWFNQLPKHVTKPINDYWGDANTNFMVVERDGKKQFVLPRIRNGNMLVLRQPPRSDDKDEDKRIFHKGEIPMNHYYLAAYFYVREHFGSDAIVHLGTHGSQEYLTGKERGLSRYDQGNLAVWDTPVFYPFIVDDVGEAMQTKRRGSATVIAHMTPPFAAAGLQGENAQIHDLMHQYKSLDDGGVKVKTGGQLKAMCFELKLCEDMAMDAAAIDADFGNFVDELHVYLEDLAAQTQPLGLHSFGELSEDRLLTSTIVQMLGSDFTKEAREFEFEHYGKSDNGAVKDDHLPFGREELETIGGFKLVRDYVVAGKDANELPKEMQAYVTEGKKHLTNMQGIREIQNLVAGLSGAYIPVKTGGDPIRHPDALPTGFNLYGFDPSKLPTKAAYEQGKELVEGIIEDYRLKHGAYLDKLAFSLWSIEAMRHYGVLESQALYAMGVKPKWSPDGRVVGTEIIPANELKRPRVDVVLSATGLYRDAFPNVMQRLAGAIKQIAELREENNSVWDNSQRIKADLIKEGMAEEEADYLSSVRIFSNASGTYGTGVGDAVVNTDTWEDDKEVADMYMSRMGFAYGTDPSKWGQDTGSAQLYAKQLSGTDVALFSRSSNVYGMNTSDDPFQYFGSIALAVRALDGQSPEMLISNLRDAKNPKAEGAAKFLAKEIRTRSLHKRWVEEMMKEDYSGAATMADRMTNFLGWQVVDPNLVRDDQWKAFYDVYVDDKFKLEINEWFEKVNPQAQAILLERMLEAVRKEYWDADEETLKAMIERLSELANKHDILVDNEKLTEFMSSKAAGFGLDIATPAPEGSAVQVPAAPQQIQGQQLQKVEQQQAEDQPWNDKLLFGLLLCFLAIGAGVFTQARQGVVK